MKKILLLFFAIATFISVNAQIISYTINRTINYSDTLLVFESSAYSYGVSIEGSGQLLSDTAFIRIVLVDNHDRNWLIYELTE